MIEEYATVRWDLGSAAEAVERRLETWTVDRVVERLWAKDHTLWSPTPLPELTDRLGWLALPGSMTASVPEILDFAAAESARGTDHVVLLGMGGSSLAPAVFQALRKPRSGLPELQVLDSTHPGAVRALEGAIDPANTVFVVSSKSGTTTETRSFYDYFRDRFAGSDETRPARFAVVTDPGTPLQRLAEEHGLQVFQADPEVGGRYSALSHFGLVPAALIGVDIVRTLEGAARMAALCRQAPAENPGARLGAAIGVLAKAGRDKVTFVTSDGLSRFADWAEQLIAESTGKNGVGVVPVTGEELVGPDSYGTDRLFVVLRQSGNPVDADADARIAALAKAGHPVIEIDVASPDDLGAEFFRWEFAVALAGAVLGINPFDQPDVQLAKDLASEAMSRPQERSPAEPASELQPIAVEDHAALERELGAWMRLAGPGAYASLQAYLAPTPEAEALVREARSLIHRVTRMATTAGYGPRFLHSTGQLHKGGPNTGLFLQLVSDACPADVSIPGADYSFGRLIAAQATGDRRALLQRGRRLVTVDLGADAIEGLKAVNLALAATVAG